MKFYLNNKSNFYFLNIAFVHLYGLFGADSMVQSLGPLSLSPLASDEVGIEKVGLWVAAVTQRIFISETSFGSICALFYFIFKNHVAVLFCLYQL